MFLQPVDEVTFERFSYYCEDFRRSVSRLEEVKESLAHLIKTSQKGSLKFIYEMMRSQERSIKDVSVACQFVRNSMVDFRDVIMKKMWTGGSKDNEGVDASMRELIEDVHSIGTRDKDVRCSKARGGKTWGASELGTKSNRPPVFSNMNRTNVAKHAREKSGSMNRQSNSFERREKRKLQKSAGSKKRGFSSQSDHCVISPKNHQSKKMEKSISRDSQILKKKLQIMADKNMSECLNLKDASNSYNPTHMKTTKKSFKASKPLKRNLKIELNDFQNPMAEAGGERQW